MSYAADTWVWITDEEHAFLPARTTAACQKGQTATVTLEDGSSREAEVGDELDPQVLSADVDNLIALNDLNEASLLHNLRIRFRANRIYTNVSSILISVNPFKMLPLYTPEVLDSYKDAADVRELPPHVFTVAGNAYKSLMQDAQSQSVIISGESGAGKTEATKLILQFIAEAAGRPGDESEGLEQQILQANPVMEALGNAKTTRNNNSSRFGKLISIKFTPGGSVSGGFIVSYLLEKSRVVAQQPGERNYHIFYQMLEGAAVDAELKESLMLGDTCEAAGFHYLSQGGETTIPGVSDLKEWRELLDALEVLQVSDDERRSLLRVLAAVLHLGDLSVEVDAGGATQEDGCKIGNQDRLATVATLLGVDQAELDKSLTSKNIGNRSVILVAYSVEQAVDARDALAKKLYSNLFDWLIKKVNDSLAQGVGGAAASAGASAGAEVEETKDNNIIGVLDIFGFESFELNSFEQLCINYCNEKLQFHFNEHIFSLEQAEYAKEGVPVDAITYTDNQPTLDLLEAKATGIFSMIDEEINVPRGSDDGFLSKAMSNHAKHPSFARPRPKQRDARNCFVVQHYAGAVAYNVANFLDKNKDKLHEGIASVMQRSGDAFVSALMAPPVAAGGDAPASGRQARGGRGKKKTPTLGAQFKTQLAQLMTTLNATQPHFIRCMKPNAEKVGDKYTAEMMLAQLRYAGLLEVCRIRQIGFPVRKDFDRFFKLYLPLGPSASNVDELLAALEANGHLSAGEWAKGTSKVFLKSGAGDVLDVKRDVALGVHAAAIQKAARGFLQRRKFAQWKAALDALRAASAARDRAALEEALTGAAELPHEGRHLAAVKEANAVLPRLVEEDRTRDLLREAVASRELSALQSAVQAAEGMDPPLAGAELAEAKALVARVEEERAVLKQLLAAVSSRDRAQLAALLARAEELEIDDTDEARQAQSLRARLDEEESVIESLRAAIEAEELNEVSALLAKMAEMGMDDRPEMAQGKATQQRLEAQLGARNGLRAAVEARSLEQLRAALAKAAEVLPADSPALADAREKEALFAAEGEAEAALKQAIEAHDLAQLEAAVAAAHAQGLSASENAQLQEALDVKGALEKEAEARAACAAAAAANDQAQLSAALAKASEIGLTAAPEVQAARDALAQMGAQSELTGKLQAAADSNDEEQLAAAVAEAEAMGMGGTEAAQLAKTSLERLREEKQVVADLQSAIEHRALQELSRGVAMAMRMGLRSKHPELVSQAKALVDELGATMKLSLQLQSAVTAHDADSLESAIAKAAELGVDNEEVAAARAALAQLGEHSRIAGELEAAMAAKDDAALRAALDAAAAASMQTALVRQARIIVDRAGLVEETKAELTAAAASGDAAGLAEALERAIELGYEGAEVEAAKQAQTQLMAGDEVAEQLRAAMKTLRIKCSRVHGITSEDAAPLFDALARASAALPEFEEATAFKQRVERQLAVQSALLAALEGSNPQALADALDEAEDLDLNLETMQAARDRLASSGRGGILGGPGGSLAGGGEGDEDDEEVDPEELKRQKEARWQKASNNKYDFHKFPRLRSPDEFVKGVVSLHKKALKEGMLKWSKSVIPKSLLQFDKDLSKAATQIHKCLLGYCGERAMSFPETLAQEVLNRGLAHEDLADEVYLQVLKHISDNPNSTSSNLAWRLLCMACNCFAPSFELSNYLLNFVLGHRGAGGAVGGYAAYVLQRLEGIFRTGVAGGIVPSAEDISAYSERPPCIVQIDILDGFTVADELPLTPDFSAASVVFIASNFLGLNADRVHLFGLFWEENNAEEGFPLHPLASDEFPGALWTEEAIAQNNGPPRRLVFRRKVVFPVDPAAEDEDEDEAEMFAHLNYVQAEYDVVNGTIPVNDEAQVVLLAAQAVSIANDGEDMPTDADALLADEDLALMSHIPELWREHHTPAEWAALVLGKRALVNGIDPTLLETRYLEAVRSSHLFGMHVVWALKASNPPQLSRVPEEVMCGFSAQGLHLLDAANPEHPVIVTVPFADIKTWEARAGTFSLTVRLDPAAGGPLQRGQAIDASLDPTYTVALTTPQYLEMNALLRDHAMALAAMPVMPPPPPPPSAP